MTYSAAPLIALTGASGFLGSRVHAAALRAGRPCRVLSRGSGILPSCSEHCDVIRGDLRQARALDQLVDGAEVLIHMAAAMGSNDDVLLHQVNGECSRALFEAASRAGVRRIVLVSTMAALRPEDGPYASSKALGQVALGNFTGTSITLQPPLIYGAGSQVSSTIARLARFRLVPVINSSAALYPVHVEDVASTCIEAALGEVVENGVYPLPGPDAIDFPTFTQRVLDAIGSPARVLRLPARLSLGLGRAMEATMAHPVLTSESVGAVLRGSVTGDFRAAADSLGFAPRGLDAGLATLRSR